MPNHNDLLRWQQLQRQKIVDPSELYSLKATVAVGQRAQTVVDHPGYQVFLDHLEETRRLAQAERDAKAKQALEGDSLGDALAKLKLQIVSLDGQLKGLGQAIDLIPTLVRRAHEAATILDSPTQA